MSVSGMINDIRLKAIVDYPNNLQSHIKDLKDLEDKITTSTRSLYDDAVKTLRAMGEQCRNKDRIVFQYTLEIEGVLACVFELEDGKFYFKAPGDNRILLGEPANHYDCYNMMGRLTQGMSNAIQVMKDAHG